MIDVGCGGGLVSEPLARHGARVTAIDAGEEAIRVARAHAAVSNLAIEFRHSVAEEIVAEGAVFDAVVSLEVIEHVANVNGFLASLAALTCPDGVLVLGTINRTLKSLAFAKIGAEYLLRWVSVGTHNWHQFVRPSEMVSGLRPHDIEPRDLVGAVFDPVRGEWRLSSDTRVNYLACFAR